MKPGLHAESSFAVKTAAALGMQGIVTAALCRTTRGETLRVKFYWRELPPHLSGLRNYLLTLVS